jgi:hypothetical protein
MLARCFVSCPINNLKERIMYTIIVRNNGYHHEYQAGSPVDAHTLFNALTKTFLHVELWLGYDMVQKYKNC